MVEAIAGRKALRANSRLYDLPHQHNEQMINDYNLAILLVWQGNMDTQYIGENPVCLTGILHSILQSIQQKLSKAIQLLHLVTSLQINHWPVSYVILHSEAYLTEFGALEAADTLLGIPLYGTDRSTVFQVLTLPLYSSELT